MRGFIDQSTTLPTPTLTMSDAANAIANLKTLKTVFGVGEQKMNVRPTTAIEIQGFFQQSEFKSQKTIKK